MAENYAMYLRKSRADIELEAIEKMETLKRHKKILNELARKQHLHVTDIYEEIVSGESIADRPEMQRLLDAVYKKKYKGVLVVEVERLARGDTRDQGEVAEAFKYSNTLIITPTKTYNPNNQFDEEYFEFGLFMSRREYKTIRRRLQTGIIESVKEGNYVGSLPPYGYTIVRLSRKQRTLEQNNQSQYVQMMFNWFTEENLSCGKIAKRLTTMGIPTLTGKNEWNRATIRDILTNNIYTGKIRWNRRKCTKEFDGNKMAKIKRRLTPDDYLVVDGKHQPIITQEQFDKAQKMFEGQVPINEDAKVINPLARLLYCKHCGKAMAYQSFRTQRNTVPRYSHRESVICKLKSAPASEVMDALILALKKYLDDFEIQISNKNITSNEHIIESLEKELSACANKREEIFSYFENKIYTMEEFIERKNKNEERIEQVQTQLQKEKSNTQSKDDIEEKITTLHQLIDTLNDDSIDAKDKNDFLKQFINRIEYDCEDLGRQKGGNVTLDVYLK